MTTEVINGIKLKDIIAGRRTVENDALLKELTASIKATAAAHGIGLIEPVVLRPRDGNTFELIAGGRRLAAVESLGLTELPEGWFRLVEATDEEVEVLRLAENLHRLDPHPVDELRCYEMLLKLGATAEDVAKKVGKPLKYVLRMVELRYLSDKARAAFRNGDLTHGVAFLIARVPAPADRDAAFKYALGQQHWTPTESDVHRWIRQTLSLRLEDAPFDKADAALVPAAGACTTCPKRSGNQALLFDKSEEFGTETCLDRACFALKRDAHVTREAEKLQAKGIVVLDEKGSTKRAEKAVKEGRLATDATALDAAAPGAGGQSPHDPHEPRREDRGGRGRDGDSVSAVIARRCAVCRRGPDPRYPVLTALLCRSCGRYICLPCTLFGRHVHRLPELRSVEILAETSA